MMSKYEEMVARRKREHGDKFSDADLDARFVAHFNTGARVRVRNHGEERTGTVGVTTGWIPAFLLMFRSNAHGSWYVLGSHDEIVAVKPSGARDYAAVSA